MFGTFGTAESTNLDLQHLIVAGAIVNGESQSEIDVYHYNEDYWIPDEVLTDRLGISLDTSESIELSTPLGQVALSKNEVISHPELGWFVSAETLQNKFNIRTQFIQEEYALAFDVPWDKSNTITSAPEKTTGIDFYAPHSSISSVHLENQLYVGLQGSSPQGSLGFGTLLDADGSFSKGVWQLQLENAGDDRIVPNRYFWTTSTDRTAFRFGTNNTELSPLLLDERFTGAEFAWTNGQIAKFTDFTSLNYADGFITSRAHVNRSIKRTDGPPAGIAELRIDGIPHARVRIDLNGQYEFKNVPYENDQYQQVTVYLYEFSGLEKPLRRIDLSRHASAQMLSSGQRLLRGGFGFSGNPATEENLSKRQFLQYRLGLSDFLSVDVGLVSQENGQRYFGGFDASVGRHWSVSADYSTFSSGGAAESSAADPGAANPGTLNSSIVDVGKTKESVASTRWSADYEKIRTNFFARIERRESVEPKRYKQSHFVNWQTDWQVTPSTHLSLYAKDVQTDQDTTRFVLPGIMGKIGRFTYFARPVVEDRYYLGFDYRRDRHRTRFAHTIKGSSTIEHSFVETPARTWTGGSTWNHSDLPDREIYAELAWFPNQNAGSFLELAARYFSGGLGGRVSWNTSINRGFTLQLQYDKSPYPNTLGSGDSTLWLKTRLSLGRSGKKIVPVNYGSGNHNRGTIAGSFVNVEGKRLDIDDVTLRIDNKSQSSGSTNGSYTIDNLQPGVYELSIDEDELPIEFVPRKTQVVAEVKASAVTSVDFVIDSLFGISGTVTEKDGGPAINTSLEISGAQGTTIEVQTDEFGFYRVVNLEPGRYQISLPSHPGKSTEVTVGDGYLFDQNITVNSSQDSS